MHLSRRRMLRGIAATLAAPTAALGARPAPLLSGIQEIVVSVFDFDHLAPPFIDTGDFARVELPDAPKEQWPAWRVPAACTRISQLLLRHQSGPAGEGSIRLVKFHGAPQRVMRSSQRSWDTGCIFDIDVLSPDTEAAYRRLQTFGWTAMGEPVEYREADIHAIQVVAVGPNGFNLAIIDNFPPPDQKRSYKVLSAYGGGTQMVADLDKALNFYLNVLGFKTNRRFDINDQDEPGYDVIGLPKPYAKDARRKLAMIGGPPLDERHRGAGVELIENSSMHGRDFSTHCVAPNVGILCPRIPVRDARQYANEIKGRRGQLFTEPQSLEIAPYGKVTAFTIRAPEGAMLEFFSKA
jgi:catechol 2,3-dioxygenase-like lactoylglutathione lyase family enzyme